MTHTENLSPEQLAASAYRAGCHAAGDAPVAWGLLHACDRAAWLRVAKQAEETLTGLEGKPVAEAAAKLREIWLNQNPGQNPLMAIDDRRWLLSWEAVARHLYWLFDDDEIEDLPALEQSWREWAQKRLQTPEPK